ncbi:DUF885 domain-containing protein [Sphingosinicella microcystinivorans]|uniref:Uncharacterized protein (DUF885 family) n=1 Tax=Sphingosinicella microcystinivorans TaxID=335406 RepID=A0AAD1D9R4_SPHMI|nr:DUF885 domain-containing protein [Sphingosinicella microcystinivorans]RKS88205.1 uncharacterized protein (DUF885 family) [Sphingosinicella microcystinivorans]BBE36017.1 hypothetical protein SmB9_36750 [Sphingosinicella microcystinivorans]
MKLGASAIALSLIASGAWAAPADDFVKLRDDMWQMTLAENPRLATSLGDRRGDGKLDDISLAGYERRLAADKAFLKRLDAISIDALPKADRIDYRILKRSLESSVAGAAFGQEATVLFTNRYGWHMAFAGLADDSPFFNKADYESYVGRLETYGKQNTDGIAVTRRAIADGFTQPCVPMAGFEKTIEGRIAPTAAQSSFMYPFRTKPATISDSDWTALKARAEKAVDTVVTPAYRDFLKFYTSEYAPKCRKSVGISETKNGAAYYAYRINQQTTTDKTAEEIHQLGLSEVARIRAEMDAVVKASGFKGDRKAYIAMLRTDPKYYAKTGEELMLRAGALAKTIDGHLPKLFGKLPRLPYTVLPIPDDQAAGNTTAYYEPGAIAAGRAGVYRVNLTELDQRPLFELPALGVHEAVPGHHLQIALQQELELHDFRKHGAFFTAFVEGWGLYSERLGIEMGLYDTPEKDMGRLSYEMWRACRLVVDTGIHAKGWTKQQAVDFMLENTALSAANVDAEVNRYITWPGQALAYKIGELKFRELRARAEKALGDKFDVRAFHDTVLENGAVPLDVLEAYFNEWLAAQTAARN